MSKTYAEHVFVGLRINCEKPNHVTLHRMGTAKHIKPDVNIIFIQMNMSLHPLEY